jgi:DNA-directed RNA polymerase subunit RPC12/RpoP
MLRRKCPNCSKKTLKVPVLSNNYICSECVAIFHQPWWANMLEVVVASMLGTSAFFYLLFNFSWVGLAAVFLVLPLLVDQLFRRFGPVKLGGVRGALRKRS